MSAPQHTSTDSQAEAPDAAAGLPPETVRTFVTLALLFHLFVAIVAAIGSSRAYSDLVDRLVVKLVAPLHYPELLGFRSYASYGLTYNLDTDYEGAAEVVLDWEAGDEAEGDRVEAKQKLAFFDPEAIALPIRRQRYLSYIRQMGDLAAAEPPSPLEVEMPMAVSRALLAEADMPDGRHRFRLWRLPTNPPAFIDDARTPPARTIYEGNIAVRGGKLDFTKADRAAASSPVVPSRSPIAPPADGIPPIDDSPLGDRAIQPPTDGLPSNLRPFDPPFDNPARPNGNR